jgi:hypothetical protein
VRAHHPLPFSPVRYFACLLEPPVMSWEEDMGCPGGWLAAAAVVFDRLTVAKRKYGYRNWAADQPLLSTFNQSMRRRS